MTNDSPCRPVLQQTISHALIHLTRWRRYRSRRPPHWPSCGLVWHARSTMRAWTLQNVIDELVQDSAGGRLFGWVIGGSVPAALDADWLTSTWDQNATLVACGPNQAVIEEVCGRWLKDLLRLPASANFALVTGCEMAHVTCLATARHSLLAKRGWATERRVKRRRTQGL